MLEEELESPRGSEHSFASEDDIIDKFTKLTRDVLPSAQRAELVESVLKLEDLPDASRLGALLQSA